MRGAPVSIAWVELDRLVVHQTHINLTYAEELRAELGDDASPARVFEFALPYDKRRDPPVEVARVGEAAWIFTSPSNDFRILDATLLEPAQVTGLDAVGDSVEARRPAASATARTTSARSRSGAGSSSTTAATARTRSALPGTRTRPASSSTSASDDLRRNRRRRPSAAGRPSDNVLTAVRPPLFKDFFDEQLRIIVNVPAP